METIEFGWLGADATNAIEKEAQKRLFAIEQAREVYQSSECIESQKSLSLQYELLKESLQTDEQRKMLLELDDLACFQAAMYGDSLFIQGFYEGVKFFRNALEAGLKQKERTAGTVRSF